MALSDKEMKNRIIDAHQDFHDAKSKKDVRAVFEDEEVGFLVLGYKKLSRLLLGWTANEVVAGSREKKEN